MTKLTSSLYPQKPHTLLLPVDVVWPMSRAIWLQGGTTARALQRA